MTGFINEWEAIARERKCKFSVSTAKELTTFKGGGSAVVFMPNSEVQFANVYCALIDGGYAPYVLGAGSNTILADGMLKTPIISTRGLNSVRVDGGKVYAGCGARIADVSAALRELDMCGLDFLSGVPATVGGAIRMNAGAFSHQTMDYVCKIRILNANLQRYGKKCDVIELKNVDKNELSFGYRQGVDCIVLGATFEGEKGREVSREKAKEYVAYRRARQPKLPSCGSVFKNGDVPSGKLIEDCGLKGTRIGGAQISPMHANFIVNVGGATAEDFMSLVELCENCVQEKFDVQLEREFVYLCNA